MIPSDNPKIETLQPQWSSLPGFSLLFDNPGNSFARVEVGIQRIRCRLQDIPELGLYASLIRAFDTTPGQLKALKEYHLCALPPESFHVTFADLINAGNVRTLSRPTYDEAQSFFQDLPNSIRQGLPPSFRSAALSQLVARTWRVRFKFSRLAVWNKQVLVARLEPDDDSKQELNEMEGLRYALDQDLVRVGKPVSPSYKPHVTLAYCLDEKGAQEAEASLPKWEQQFREMTKNQVIEFRSVTLYGFRNMAEFFRASDEPAAMFIPRAPLNDNERLRIKGDQKVVVTRLYPGETPITTDRWDPRGSRGGCPVLLSENLEIAFFNEKAPQDRHYHLQATEIYAVLQGVMKIEVESRCYQLSAGETIVIPPGAVHKVEANSEPFLASVVAANSGGARDKFTVGGQVPVPNLSLVAFYHQPKPNALASLIEKVTGMVERRLAASSLSTSQFAKYGVHQLHATIIGLEGVRLKSQLYNANFWSNNASSRQMDIQEFVSLLKDFCTSRQPLFTVRIGGFTPGTCDCAGPALLDWACQSGSEFHSFNRSSFQGSFYVAPKDPTKLNSVVLTGWPVDKTHQRFPRSLYSLRYAAAGAGFQDKFHRRDKPHWRDDDFWITLGKLSHVPQGVMDEIEKEVREYLSKEPPLVIEITLDDLAVVLYEDTELKRAKRVVPLAEVLENPEALTSLYSEIGGSDRP